MKFRASRTPAPFIAMRQPMSRRRFLEGAGIALSLPFLDAMLPSLARAAAMRASIVWSGSVR